MNNIYSIAKLAILCYNTTFVFPRQSISDTKYNVNVIKVQMDKVYYYINYNNHCAQYHYNTWQPFLYSFLELMFFYMYVNIKVAT